nr:auxilin-like protein [Tanacetum cinerariifolium]
MFDVNDLQGEEVFLQEDVVDKEVINVASIATTDNGAATMTADEVTLAQALIEIKNTKSKAKGIVLQKPIPTQYDRDVLFDICRRARISAKKEELVNFLTDQSDGRSKLRRVDVLVFGGIGGKHACVDLTGVSPFVRRAGISGKKEEPVNFLTDPSDGRSKLGRADVLVFGGIGGKHACVDLTGVSPLVRLSIHGFTAGQVALKAASCKVTKHKKACIENQHVFIHLRLIPLISLHLRRWSYSAEFNGLCIKML